MICQEEGGDDIFNFLLVARLGEHFHSRSETLGEAVRKTLNVDQKQVDCKRVASILTIVMEPS